MNKVVQLFTSRTAWTGVAMFVINYAPFIGSIVPAQWKPLIDAILTLLMFYFHVNPSQNYAANTSQQS